MSKSILTSGTISLHYSSSNHSKASCNDGSSENPLILAPIPVDNWVYPYGQGEVIWGILLVSGIFGVNLWVLWIVAQSRVLWKPRHLWMACLCITDLLVGTHKVFELLLLVLPREWHHLCVIHKATLGIPYILNILLLTLLSLDRFIAVCYPFFYSSVVSNKHVGIGFVLVIVTGIGLSGVSITVGLSDTVCKVHCLQLIYLTVILTICSILTLFFNTSVLRIAKKQLSTIYVNGTAVKRRRVSVLCTNCGHKNEAFMSTLISMPLEVDSLPTESTVYMHNPNRNHRNKMLLPIAASESTAILGQQVDSIHSIGSVTQKNPPVTLHLTLNIINDAVHPADDKNENPESLTTLVRSTSLPTFPEEPITIEVGDIFPSNADLPTEQKLENPQIPSSHNFLPRYRSLFSCHNLVNEHSHSIHMSMGNRIQLFRNSHFARAHMFHMGRLFPSIRFARTVLLIMIPMWIFILPVITIIPLRRNCEDGSPDFACSIIKSLWSYLLVHIRSLLPLQAILDTLIYSCGSKEFRHVLSKSTSNYVGKGKV